MHFLLFTGDDVFRPVAQLSFGERVRLMLALLVPPVIAWYGLTHRRGTHKHES